MLEYHILWCQSTLQRARQPIPYQTRTVVAVPCGCCGKWPSKCRCVGQSLLIALGCPQSPTFPAALRNWPWGSLDFNKTTRAHTLLPTHAPVTRTHTHTPTPPVSVPSLCIPPFYGELAGSRGAPGLNPQKTTRNVTINRASDKMSDSLPNARYQ